MIKMKLIELVQHTLAGGQINPDIWKKAHPTVVAEHVNLAMNTILYEVFRKEPNALDIYCKTVDAGVTKGDNGWYSDLGLSPMQFPNNNYGIARISLPEDDYSLTFLPLSKLAHATNSRSGVIGRMGIIPFRYEQGRILYGSESSLVDIPKVKISVVLPFSEMDDTDDIIIPLGTGVTLFQTIVDLMKGTKPVDKSNNNNPDA
jgi:hypothetical protein